MKHKKKKWSYSHPIRDLNKAKILELLKENWSTGFTQKEIIKKTKLTKPTVISILKELKSEHRIHRLASIYFPEFDDDFAFAYFFADYVDHFLIKIMENKENTSNVVDTQHISKVVVKNSINKSIFEFVNMMGALITYILIESSSVYAEDREPAKIEELINNIFKGVIWKDIFYQFQKLFENYYHNKQASSDIKEFDQLSESLESLYPTLYETIDRNRVKYFEDWVKYNPRDNNIYENCHHEWKQRDIFRYGTFYECVHCRCHKLKELPTKDK
jgi:DNA-binding Lrp family transcriptional regulator